MRLFINAMLAFAFFGFAAGLAPASVYQMARLRTVKSEPAIAGATPPVKLRSSILR